MDTKREGSKKGLQWCWALMIVLSLVAGFLLSGLFNPVQGLAVTFHNNSEVMIESIQLDFGSADTQSRIQAFRIAPGQERLLLLNHEPGMGFSVQVNYRDGRRQEFCALGGDEQSTPDIYLQP